MEDAALHGPVVPALFGVLPVHVAPVQIAAVAGLDGVVTVAVVVQLADFIPGVQHRDAAQGEHVGMQHHVQPNGQLKRRVVARFQRGLYAAQRRGGAAHARVAQAGVVVVQLAPGGTARNPAAEIVVEEPLVGHLLLAEPAQEVIIQPPADVVVAAQVVQERVHLRQREHLAQLVPEQLHVPGGHGVPGGGHGGDVVEQVTLGLLHRTEVGHHLAGLHDHFAQQHRAGTGDFAHHAHHPDQGVHLGQVAAGGAQRLPDVGRGVQPDDVDAVVAQEEHVVGHVVEHHGVGVIQIPLIGPEGGHDHLVELRAPAEISRRGGGKHLGHGLLVGVGNLPAVIEEIALLAAHIPLPRPAGPLVVLGGVVHHKIQAHGNAAAVAILRQRRQIVHGAQLGLYLAEIADRVAAVGAVRGALQQGHQMQIVDAAFLNVVQLAAHALQISGEGAHVHQHARHVVALIPAGIGLPPAVDLPQGLRPRLVGGVDHIDEVIPGHLVIAIQPGVKLPELRLVAFKPGGKLGGPCLSFHPPHPFM